MTTVANNTMKLSKQTVAILKSMAGINSNIHVLPGDELVCVSPGKNIMFNAHVEEQFPTEFAIWDLTQFLGTHSLFNDPKTGRWLSPTEDLESSSGEGSL